MKDRAALYLIKEAEEKGLPKDYQYNNFLMVEMGKIKIILKLFLRTSCLKFAKVEESPLPNGSLRAML